MNCDQVELLLDAYVDGEFIDATQVRDVETHLEECQGCRQKLEAIEALRAGIGQSGLYYAAPSKLHEKIESIGRPKRLFWSTKTRWLLANAVVVLLLFGFFGRSLIRNRGYEIEVELVDSHIRSLQTNHLFDVASSDKHTVKPWFQGKLDFSPEVPDLAQEGFPLLGGRLDYVDRHPAAVLVYGRGKHIVSVFVALMDQGAPAFDLHGHNGFSIEQWVERGLTYRAISDIDASTLEHFRERFETGTHWGGWSKAAQ